VHAATNATGNVLTNALYVNLICDFEVVARHVKLEPLRICAKLMQLQAALILEQQIVHRPKSALRPCRFRGLRRKQGVEMHFFEGEVSEHEAKAAFEVSEHQPYRGRGLFAVRAFEIAVFNHRCARVRPAHHVVSFIHRYREIKLSKSVHFFRPCHQG